MARRKTAAQQQAEYHFQRRTQIIGEIGAIARDVIRWGAGIWIASYVYQAIAMLAGQTTLANIGIRFLANVRVSEGLCWLFGTGGVIYGWRQRKLRRDTVERLQGRNQEYEQMLDPRRTSSRLTVRGDTRPEDDL